MEVNNKDEYNKKKDNLVGDDDISEKSSGFDDDANTELNSNKPEVTTPSPYSSFAKKVFFISLSLVLFIFLILALLKLAEARNFANAPSPFSLAVRELGFINKKIILRHGRDVSESKISQNEQELALLRILHSLGYLKPKYVWKTLSKMGSIGNPSETFQEIMSIIVLANGLVDTPDTFDADILRKNLFKSTALSKIDAADFLIYSFQFVFEDQDSDSTAESSSSINTSAQKIILKEAESLGIIERLYPQYDEYDEAWIMSEARPIFHTRVIDYYKTLSESKIQIKGGTVSIGNDRDVYAEKDGMIQGLKTSLDDMVEGSNKIDELDVALFTQTTEDKIQEGMDYILSVSTRNNIKLNMSNPFYFCVEQAQCEPGAPANRHLPNYAVNEINKIDETLMAYDVLKTISSYFNRPSLGSESQQKIGEIISSNSVYDAAEKFIGKIKAGQIMKKAEYFILVQTNNPFTEKDQLMAKFAIDEILDRENMSDVKVNVDVSGFKNKSYANVVAVELANLLAQRYKINEIKSSRDIMSLLYKTRDNSEILLHGEMPNFPSEYKPKSFFERAVRLFDK